VHARVLRPAAGFGLAVKRSAQQPPHATVINHRKTRAAEAVETFSLGKINGSQFSQA
jgi:hypothetical protein